MKAPKLEIPDGSAAQQLRHKLNLNQAEFWGRLKVTQSGGSRYELCIPVMLTPISSDCDPLALEVLAHLFQRW